jgi:hypothetical protein
MRKLAFILLFGSAVAQSMAFTKEKKINVNFNRNVEFVGFVFFLGSFGDVYENNENITSNGKTTYKDWYKYQLMVYRKYKMHKSNPAVARIIPYLERLDGGTLLRLILKVGDLPKATLNSTVEPTDYIAFSRSKDPTEALKNAIDFLDAMNALYKDVRFDEYLEHHRRYYNQALSEITANLPDVRFVNAMEKFYNQSFDSYNLLPSLLAPSGMAWGLMISDKGQTHIYNTFAPFAVPDISNEKFLKMGFADKTYLRELSTHEFGHSFVGPLIGQVPDSLIKATTPLFEPIKTAMTDQDYLTWKSCLNEHFVRAGEVVIAEIIGEVETADRLRKDYINDRKFIYLPSVINELLKYRQGSASYVDVAIRAISNLNEYH